MLIAQRRRLSQYYYDLPAEERPKPQKPIRAKALLDVDTLLLAGIDYPACWDWEHGVFRCRVDHVRADADAVWTLFKDWHEERCAMCGSQNNPLMLDHDHDSDLIRGLLCRRCNKREGNQWSPGYLVVGYREHNLARLLRVTLAYARISKTVGIDDRLH